MKFNYQIEAEVGVGNINALKHFERACITGYSLPIQQSLTSAWELTLFFNNKMVVEFSSISNQVDGWEELGALKMKFKVASNKNLNNEVYKKIGIPEFCITDIECLYFEDDDVYIESGIIFNNDIGDQIVITTGISPGSVSVKAAFNE